MPLDTSIPLHVQPIKLMSPQDQYAIQNQVEQNALAKQLGQMKLDEANYQTQRRNKLNDLLSQNYSKPEDRESALLQGGFSDEAMKLGKDRREIMKTDAETAEKQFKVKKEKLGVLGSVFGRVAQNPTLDTANQALDYLEQTGIYKPEQIQQWRQQATANPASIKPFAEQAYASAIDADKQLTAQLTAKRDAESARHNRASEGIQIRGQNMTDARAREANAIQKDQKPLTESQSKAAAFGARMKAANEVFDSLAADGKLVSTPGSRAGFGIGSVVNALNSTKGQQLDQAKRDFINAALRRESGAVIADSEFDNAEKQYFPQIGEGPEVIAQKKRNREIAMRGILADVPESRRDSVVREITGPSTKAPNIDSLLEKYK